MFLPKEAEELDVEAFEEPFWEQCRCTFLSQPDVKKRIQARHPGIEDKVRFFDLPAGEDDLPSLLCEIRAALFPHTAGRVSMVAPYYFLLQTGLAQRQHRGPASGEALRLFANNYTMQGFKIKQCKPILNRVLCHLALMPTEDLDACRFLGRINRIYVMDLSFIPEKYRLDRKRARSILTGCLKQWLLTLECRLKNTASQDPAGENGALAYTRVLMDDVSGPDLPEHGK